MGSEMEPDKTRAKMIAELESLLNDEKAHLAKLTRTSTLMKVIGIVLLLVALVVVGTPWHWPSAVAVVFAAVGAFLSGASVAFDTSFRSWPILRPLLKDNALEILRTRT